MLSTEKTKGDVNRKIDGGKPGGREGGVCGGATPRERPTMGTGQTENKAERQQGDKLSLVKLTATNFPLSD